MRFLAVLRSDHMIDLRTVQRSGQRTTIVKLMNYRKLRQTAFGNSTTVEPTDGTTLGTTLGPQTRTEEHKNNPPNPPKGGRRLKEAEKKRMKVRENTELMIRIGSWFDRKPDTLWSVYEAEALEQIGGMKAEDLKLMERYYTARINERDIRRRDLPTLLNNWTSELDRARKYRPKRETA